MFYNQSIFMRVSEIMDRDVIKTNSDISINHAVEMMLSNARDEVIVVKKDADKEYIEGMLTKTDICRLKKEKIDFTQPVKDYMSTEVCTILQSEKVKSARDIMVSKGIGRLPVTDGAEVIGIVTSKDLLDTFYVAVEDIVLQLSTILENLHEAVCVVNNEGVVSLWNQSSEKLYGINSSEIIGKNIRKALMWQ